MAPYLAALLLVGASLLLGVATCRASSASVSLAPVVGISLLIALATLTVLLPGTAATGAVVLVLAMAAASVYLARSRFHPARKAIVGPLLTGVGAAAVTTLPFLSAGHVGILGMSLNNDTSVHVLWSEGLRSSLMESLYPSNAGYPLGPHSLLAAVAQGTGLATADVLVGLLIATVILFAITAFGVLRAVPLVVRVPAAIFTAVPYLAAAWYAQGAFKEPMMALLLLGFALGIYALFTPNAQLRASSLVPVGLIAAGSLLTYSYLAAAWLGIAGALVVVLVLITRRPQPSAVLAAVRAAIIPISIGVAIAVAATATEIPRILRYLGTVGASPAAGQGGIGSAELGNLAGPLPGSEALGIWPSGDFRFSPAPDAFLFSELRVLALVALIGGVLYLLVRRRDAGLLAAFGAAAVVWALSDGAQSPYVTAKALVILSPLIALVTLRALLPVGFPSATAWRGVYALRIGVAGIVIVAGLFSTQRVLRATPVESRAQRDQLAQLQPLVKAGPTLFLGDDDYAAVRLDDMRLGYIGVGFPSSIAVPTRPEKPFQYGNAVDWDSVSAQTLDRFRYVVTVRSPYASSAPSNFRLLRRTPLYEAWERTGPTVPRSTIERDDAPAGVLNCARHPRARTLSRNPGVAAVERHDPVMLAGALPAIGVTGAIPVAVKLSKGVWNLGMRYTSPIPLRLQFESTRLPEVPANTTRPGAWWPVGTWRSDGRPHTLMVIGERQSRLSDTAFPASVSGIVAVRSGGDELVPLRRACGRMVDWYQTR